MAASAKNKSQWVDLMYRVANLDVSVASPNVFDKLTTVAEGISPFSLAG